MYLRIDTIPNLRLLFKVLHLHPPSLIDPLELLPLKRHLLLNILAGEDGLQVHPGRLALHHDLEGFSDEGYFVLHVVGFVQDALDIGGGF